MSEELTRHKLKEEEDNNRRIEDEIISIFNDPKKDAFSSAIAETLGLHRNSLSGRRVWNLSRPLSLGENYFPANELVSLKNLLDVIKEHRAKDKKGRRTKNQLRNVKELTDNVEGLEGILANMQEENAQLILEIYELKDALRLHARRLDQSETALRISTDDVNKLRQERSDLKTRINDLEAENKDLKEQKDKRGSLILLKPQDDREEGGQDDGKH